MSTLARRLSVFTARGIPPKWCVRMRDEDGTQYWDGRMGWTFSFRQAKKYNSEELANKVVNKLNEGKTRLTVGDPRAVVCSADKVTAKFAMRPTPKSKRGMFDGWSLEKLHAALTKAKAAMESAKAKGKVPKALRSHFSQLTFAIRAKQKGGKKWGKVATAKLIRMLANDSHLTINATLLIRLLEWAREKSSNDDMLHSLVERMMELNEAEKQGAEFTMDDAEKLGVAG